MNWLTMTSIDIYRLAMTGGNRAIGAGNKATNYKGADTSSFTALRRAFVNVSATQDKGRNGQTGMAMRKLATDLLQTGKVFPTAGLQVESDGLRVNNSDFRIAVPTSGGRYNNNRGTYTLKEGVYKLMNVVVEVCKPGMLEPNCYAYTDPQRIY
ncbi:hypothetical protein [Neisseria chenwenguii]|nr:hypothetical protein [Neisseria chenwenguii]